MLHSTALSAYDSRVGLAIHIFFPDIDGPGCVTAFLDVNGRNGELKRQANHSASTYYLLYV